MCSWSHEELQERREKDTEVVQVLRQQPKWQLRARWFVSPPCILYKALVRSSQSCRSQFCAELLPTLHAGLLCLAQGSDTAGKMSPWGYCRKKNGRGWKPVGFANCTVPTHRPCACRSTNKTDTARLADLGSSQELPKYQESMSRRKCWLWAAWVRGALIMFSESQMHQSDVILGISGSALVSHFTPDLTVGQQRA